MTDHLTTRSPSHLLAGLLYHEYCCLFLASLISLGILVSTGAGHLFHLPLLGGCIAIILAARFHRHKGTSLRSRVRFLTAYGLMLWIYTAVADLIPLMQLTTYDDELRSIDRFIFGETPALMCPAQPWLTELMSCGYLSYQIYIHGSIILYFFIDPDRIQRLFTFLFPAFTLGIMGYFFVPAIGPWRAYPSEFLDPLQGWWITELNAMVVAQGSSVYDVFPSLHTLGTLVLLDHDRWYRPRWFRVMSPMSVILISSTIYLRYHYAIDLIVGLILFLCVRSYNWRWDHTQNST